MVIGVIREAVGTGTDDRTTPKDSSAALHDGNTGQRNLASRHEKTSLPGDGGEGQMMMKRV